MHHCVSAAPLQLVLFLLFCVFLSGAVGLSGRHFASDVLHVFMGIFTSNVASCWAAV